MKLNWAVLALVLPASTLFVGQTMAADPRLTYSATVFRAAATLS